MSIREGHQSLLKIYVLDNSEIVDKADAAQTVTEASELGENHIAMSTMTSFQPSVAG